MHGVGIATGLFTSAAAGILAALLLAPFAALRRFFFALNAGLALAFLGLAAPYGAALPAAAGGAGTASWASAARLAAAALAVIYIAALQRRGGWPARPLLGAAAAAALTASALEGAAAAGGAREGWIFAASALAAAALLGAAIVAMLLGHWYLVRSGLSEAYLVRFSRLTVWAVGVRAGLLLLALLLIGAQSAPGVAAFLRQAAIDRGFFFWTRIGLGIVGPAVFGWMACETARIRSTQSATGILYIAVIFVLMGEFLARYLTVAGAGPM